MYFDINHVNKRNKALQFRFFCEELLFVGFVLAKCYPVAFPSLIQYECMSFDHFIIIEALNQRLATCAIS